MTKMDMQTARAIDAMVAALEAVAGSADDVEARDKARDILDTAFNDWARKTQSPYDEARECEGHPAGEFDPMGQTVYCDGSCR